ncbi:hypothetical protein GCM10020256_12610 [Streptomyces thermocoprophilus]
MSDTVAPPGVPVRLAAVFLPAPLPRDGRVAFWDPDDRPLADAPGADRTELTVVRRHGTSVRRRTVPALTLPLAAALPLLVHARHAPAAHPATACWGAAAQHALRLAARGRLLPGLTPTGHDAWRAGPLDPEDIAHLRAVAAALPYEGHAVPLPGPGPLTLPAPDALMRTFLDAVADTLPRTPAAPHAFGRPFAAREPQRLHRARDWAAEVAAGMDAGVRISLRLDLSAHDLFDRTGDDTEGAGARRAGAAIVQVHSLADPTLIADAAALWAGEADSSFGPRARVDTALAVRRAARVWPPLGRLAEQDTPDVLALSEEEVGDLLGTAASRLAAAGVAVHWPRDLAQNLTATAVVRPAPGSATDGTGFFDSEELLQFRWQLALGGDPLTEAEMDTLAEAHRPVVRLRDRWVLVDPALVRKARKRDLGLLDPVDALAVALTGSAEIDGETVEAVPAGTLAALRDRLTAGPRPADPPPGLAATLRDYQLRGLAWLDLMTSLGLGGCLADDMGLGKTVTLIALHLKRARPEPTLVVRPASLLGNWQREITRFAPGVPVRRYHGPDRTLDGLDGGFVLTTYGTMRSAAPALAAQQWGMIVADEAQHVKNPYSATAKALRTLPAPARVALTGTPRREQPLRTVGAARLDHPRTARPAEVLPLPARPRGGERRGRRGRRAPRPPGPALPAATEEVRPGHRARAAAQDGDRPPGAAHPRTGRAVRGRRTRIHGRHRDRRRHRPTRPRPETARRAQADLRPPRAVSEGGSRHRPPRPARRPLRQTRPARRTAGHPPRRRRLRPGVHPVRRHGPPDHRAPRGPRDPRGPAARRHTRTGTREHGGPLPERLHPPSWCSPSRPQAPA